MGFNKSFRISIFLILTILSSSVFWLNDSFLNNRVKDKIRYRRYGYLIISIFIFFLFEAFPMALDFYGDSLYLKRDTNFIIKEWDSRLVVELFTPQVFNTKTGVLTYFEMSNFFGWLTQTNGTEVARILGAFWGGVYCFVWLSFVNRYIKILGWRILLFAMGLLSPLVLVFMGHYETYYYSYVMIMIWVSSLGLYFKNRKRIWLFVLPFLFVLLLKTHITNWLFFPSFLFVYLYHFKNTSFFKPIAKIDGVIKSWNSEYSGFFSIKGGFIYMILPFFIILLYAYFFIYQNHDGPRMFSKDEFEDTLFLPLYTIEAYPLNKYNLFGFSHIWDYLQLIFSWSGGVILVLFSLIFFFKKKINWKEPFILIITISGIMFLITYFMLNPLLSMPTDWDLFSTPGIIFMMLVVVLVSQLENQLPVKFFFGGVMSFIVLNFLVLYIHTDGSRLAKRMEHVSSRVYKTYWIGSSTNIINVGDLQKDEHMRKAFYERTIKKLKPFAADHDKEYANILMFSGLNLKKLNNKLAAVTHFEEAVKYAPILGKNLFHSCVTHFELGNFKQSYKYVNELVRLRYPPFDKTLKMGVHISLAATEYQSAADYAVTYLNRFDKHPTILEVENRLRTGDRIHSLIDLFAKE